jgi:hypothetical protein
MVCIFEMRPFWTYFEIRQKARRHRIRCSGGALELHFRSRGFPSNTQVALQDASQIPPPNFGRDGH